MIPELNALIGTGTSVNPDSGHFFSLLPRLIISGFILFGLGLLPAVAYYQLLHSRNEQLQSDMEMQKSFRTKKSSDRSEFTWGWGHRTDENGSIVQMNPVAEHLTGWSISAAKGCNIKQVLVIES